ncbi:hypothetical protein SELMODRAFT_425098 [Selaginella moellendorffii]|uniref:Uncharacterized protein n=1 Tax=Selaginella moellendorffii TaxID=88036 RepID=D8SS06_SELML|nr:hypothetical protein SELMODRAFT_425098 [Selaginella moellendorffii]
MPNGQALLPVSGRCAKPVEGVVCERCRLVSYCSVRSMAGVQDVKLYDLCFAASGNLCGYSGKVRVLVNDNNAQVSVQNFMILELLKLFSRDAVEVAIALCRLGCSQEMRISRALGYNHYCMQALFCPTSPRKEIFHQMAVLQQSMVDQPFVGIGQASFAQFGPNAAGGADGPVENTMESLFSQHGRSFTFILDSFSFVTKEDVSCLSPSNSSARMLDCLLIS